MKFKLFVYLGFLILATLPVAVFAQSGSQQPELFENAELQEDLNYFTAVFRSIHPKPYWYLPTEEFDTTLIQFRTELPDTASVTEFYSSLLPFINKIGDENTRVYFPAFVLADYIQKEGAFFPFLIQIIDNEIFITENLLPGNTIPQGAKISAINGIGATRILKKMQQMIPDQKETLQQSEIIENFSLLLWTAFQFDAPYELSIRLPQEGIIHTYNVDGVPAEKLGITSGNENKTLTNDFGFSVDQNRNFATVRITSYSSHPELKKFLSDAFSQIKKSGVDHVILDIRNLKSDDFAFPDAVLQYVTTTPYRHYAAIEAKSSPMTKSFYRNNYAQQKKHDLKFVRDKKTVRKAYRMVLKGIDYASVYYAPEVKKPFKGGQEFPGEFYLLVNEGTKNSATVLAAIVQDHKLGLVIGKETGSRASRFRELYHFSLPNTGIECTVPHRYYLRPSSFDSGFGVLPDYTVDPDPTDIAQGKDSMIEFAAGLFKKREGFREKRAAYEKRINKK
ncbi:MAG: hypothetical protein EOL88_03445 [Bacteroidia bacterium]|nr:hypothetical protein [Bacteroidia bacterium]